MFREVYSLLCGFFCHLSASFCCSTLFLILPGTHLLRLLLYGLCLSPLSPPPFSLPLSASTAIPPSISTPPLRPTSLLQASSDERCITLDVGTFACSQLPVDAKLLYPFALLPGGDA